MRGDLVAQAAQRERTGHLRGKILQEHRRAQGLVLLVSRQHDPRHADIAIMAVTVERLSSRRHRARETGRVPGADADALQAGGDTGGVCVVENDQVRGVGSGQPGVEGVLIDDHPCRADCGRIVHRPHVPRPRELIEEFGNLVPDQHLVRRVRDGVTEGSQVRAELRAQHLALAGQFAPRLRS